MHLQALVIILTTLSKLEEEERQVSSMIHSARPTVSPVALISFEICFVLKNEDGPTDGRTDDMCKNNK